MEIVTPRGRVTKGVMDALLLVMVVLVSVAAAHVYLQFMEV
jgi:hypothetical protein